MTLTYPASADLAELTGTRSFGAVTTAPGDWIVVELTMDNNQAATAAPVTCTGLTFGIQNTINLGSAGSHTFGTQSTAPDAVGGSRTVTITPSNANKYRARLTVVRGSSGVGNKAVGALDAATVSLTRSGTGSGIFMAVGDWNAGAVGSPTWTPGGATVASEQGAGTATYIFGRWDNSGAPGTASHGISSPSYVNPSIGVLEMLAAAGSSEPGIYPYGQVGPGPGPWGTDALVPDAVSTTLSSTTTPVSQTLDLQWASYVQVSQASDLRWAVLATISQATDLRWAVLSPVSQATDLRWLSYVSVSQASDLRWASYVKVSQASDLRWAVLASISQTTDLRWRVFNVVSQATDLRWLSYAQVVQASDLRWSVYNSIAQASDMRWRVSVLVSQTIDLRWIVVSSSTTISQAMDLRWLSYAQVAQASDLRWRVSAVVLGSLDARWAVRVLAAQALSVPWAVRGVVAGALDVRWAFLVGVGADSALLWVVRAQVSAGIELLWVSEETVLPLYPDRVYYGTTEATAYLDDTATSSVTEAIVYLDDGATSHDDQVTTWP